MLAIARKERAYGALGAWNRHVLTAVQLAHEQTAAALDLTGENDAPSIGRDATTRRARPEASRG